MGGSIIRSSLIDLHILEREISRNVAKTIAFLRRSKIQRLLIISQDLIIDKLRIRVVR